MKIHRSVSSLAAAAVVAVAAWGMAGAAQAGDVYWTVGVSSPGVQLGLASAPPLVVHQPPVYVAPQSVYMTPQPVYMAPRPVVYAPPAPVYLAPPQYVRADWQRPGHAWGRHHKYRHHAPAHFEGGRFRPERDHRQR